MPLVPLVVVGVSFLLFFWLLTALRQEKRQQQSTRRKEDKELPAYKECSTETVFLGAEAALYLVPTGKKVVEQARDWQSHKGLIAYSTLRKAY